MTTFENPRFDNFRKVVKSKAPRFDNFRKVVKSKAPRFDNFRKVVKSKAPRFDNFRKVVKSKAPRFDNFRKVVNSKLSTLIGPPLILSSVLVFSQLALTAPNIRTREIPDSYLDNKAIPRNTDPYHGRRQNVVATHKCRWVQPL